MEGLADDADHDSPIYRQMFFRYSCLPIPLLHQVKAFLKQFIQLVVRLNLGLGGFGLHPSFAEVLNYRIQLRNQLDVLPLHGVGRGGRGIEQRAMSGSSRFLFHVLKVQTC